MRSGKFFLTLKSEAAAFIWPKLGTASLGLQVTYMIGKSKAAV